MGSLTATSEGIYFYRDVYNTNSARPNGYYRVGGLQTHASLGSNGQSYVDHRINRYIDAIYTAGEDTLIVLISLIVAQGQGSSIQVKDPDTNAFITTSTIGNPTSGQYIFLQGTLFTVIRPRQQWRYVTASGYANPAYYIDTWCETNPGTNPPYSITP